MIVKYATGTILLLTVGGIVYGLSQGDRNPNKNISVYNYIRERKRLLFLNNVQNIPIMEKTCAFFNYGINHFKI